MNTKLVESLAQIILSLSDEERILLYEKAFHPFSAVDSNGLGDEPFVGIWQGREEMEDSTAWVHSVRQQHWVGDGSTNSD